jgi:hypothetical protein
MTIIEQCIARMSLLDQADRLLSEIRVHGHGLPASEAVVQHRERLLRARRHIETANAIPLAE